MADAFGGNVWQASDGDGRLTAQVYTGPALGESGLSLKYDGDGHVTELTQFSDAAMTQVEATVDSTFDPSGNLIDLALTDGNLNPLARYVYQYDRANRLTREIDTLGGQSTTTNYGYDPSGELTQAGGQSFTYDANGNRTTAGFVTGPGNRLLDDGTWAFTYDAVGNVITRTNHSTHETWTYSYDNDNHLILAVHKDGTGSVLVTVALSYDAFGQLVQQDVTPPSLNSTAMRYARDADGNIWAESVWTYRPHGSTAPDIYRKLSVPVNGQMQTYATIVDGSKQWYELDHLGSVRQVVDDSLTVQDQLTYDAYGNLTAVTQPPLTPEVGYAQGLTSWTLGLTNFGARWYNAADGRWLTQDPVGLDAGPNPYGYVKNAPTNETDPTGLEGESINLPTNRAPSCMDCHGTGILAGQRRFEDLTPEQQTSILRWNSGSYGPLNPVVRRVNGALRVAAGGIALVGAIGASESVVGVIVAVPLAAWSGDQAQAGLKEMWTGEPQTSFGGAYLESKIKSKPNGMMAGMAYDTFPPMVLGLLPRGTPVVRVYRVEGVPNTRILIGDAGQVAILDPNRTLYVNFGSKARAEHYLAQKLSSTQKLGPLPGASVKSFEVPKSFLEELRSCAVTEHELFENPMLKDRPLVADPTKAPDQFGLRPAQIEALKKVGGTRMTTELERVDCGPRQEESPGGMGTVRFIAKCQGNAEQVLKTARMTLRVALVLSESAVFDEKEWASCLPGPFVKNCVQSPSQEEMDRAMKLPLEERVELQRWQKWSVRAFMNSFLPHLEVRNWSWWDAAVLDNDHIAVAVEVSEWPFPWESLRWLFRGSGASDLNPEP